MPDEGQPVWIERFDFCQPFDSSGEPERVHDDDVPVGVLQPMFDCVAADEPEATGQEDSLTHPASSSP